MSDRDLLINPKNVKFLDLLHICMKNFGNPRIRGSHHIFKTPWQGDPRINIQKDGNMAKPYQVKMIVAALEKLEKKKNLEEENDKPKNTKNDKKSKPEGKNGEK
jgi:hypothetical protein